MPRMQKPISCHSKWVTIKWTNWVNQSQTSDDQRLKSRKTLSQKMTTPLACSSRYQLILSHSTSRVIWTRKALTWAASSSLRWIPMLPAWCSRATTSSPSTSTQSNPTIKCQIRTNRTPKTKATQMLLSMTSWSNKMLPTTSLPQTWTCKTLTKKLGLHNYLRWTKTLHYEQVPLPSNSLKTLILLTPKKAGLLRERCGQRCKDWFLTIHRIRAPWSSQTRINQRRWMLWVPSQILPKMKTSRKEQKKTLSQQYSAFHNQLQVIRGSMKNLQAPNNNPLLKLNHLKRRN